jgi:thiol-disulfide isomerase/thioredoxin
MEFRIPVWWVVGLSVVLAAPLLRADNALPDGIRVFEPGRAPAFSLSDMDGGHFDLTDVRGRWVFVHFWASWCGPCRKEMPAIERMTDFVSNEELVVVLVNTAEGEDTIFQFMAAVAPGLSTLLDADGLVTEAWEPRGLPATYLVDPEGWIRYQALGGRPWDQPTYLRFLKGLSRESE